MLLFIVGYCLYSAAMFGIAFFRKFRHKSRQLIVEYYLHWRTTFEISFSGSSNTNHDSLIVEYYFHWITTFEISFSGIVQTQTTTAYCRILPTQDHHVCDILFRQFRHKTRQLIVDYIYTTYTGLPRLRYLFQVVQTQTTTAYCRILPTLDHHV